MARYFDDSKRDQWLDDAWKDYQKKQKASGKKKVKPTTKKKTVKKKK